MAKKKAPGKVPMAETCPGCGHLLPENKVLCSLSHTIDPGGRLCSDCGRKETLDAGWAQGRRVGLLRAQVCEDVTIKPLEG